LSDGIVVKLSDGIVVKAVLMNALIIKLPKTPKSASLQLTEK
jgi:hypothetical protein